VSGRLFTVYCRSFVMYLLCLGYVVGALNACLVTGE
jgi:hypothetical protein